MSKINERQVALKTGGNFTLLKDYLDKRIVKSMPFQEITLTLAGVSFQVLPSGTFPGFIAKDATTAEVDGSIMAATGAWAIGTPAFDNTFATAQDPYGNILNLVDVRDATSHDPVYDTDGRKVYGLITCGAATTDGMAVGTGGTANLEVSFVKNDGSGAFVAVTLTGTYEIYLNKVNQARYDEVIELEGGAREFDVVADVTTQYLAQYTVTTAFVATELFTISTGAGSVAGVSTPAGDNAAIGAWLDGAGKFNGNKFIVLLNGVEQVKGTGLDVEYSAADTLVLGFDADVSDVITIKAVF